MNVVANTHDKDDMHLSPKAVFATMTCCRDFFWRQYVIVANTHDKNDTHLSPKAIFVTMTCRHDFMFQWAK